VSKTKLKVLDQQSGNDWTLYQGDSAEVIRGIPENSIGYSIFSPPFASLYVYSSSERDMGNCRDHAEFAEHLRFLLREMLRATMPGRLMSMHCMLMPTSKARDGIIGLTDFRGDLIRAAQAEGWAYHSEVTIWKDPVTAMQRTKALGLLHKQLLKDSAMSRQGIPDYLCTFRKPGTNPHPVEKKLEPSWPDVETRASIEMWQRYASPVWASSDGFDSEGFVKYCEPTEDNDDKRGIRASDTLQYVSAREEADERHICLARGSLVLTDRGFVEIQDVKIGDYCLTHMGRWRPVEAVACTGVRKTINVRAQGVGALRLTPEHKLWARRVRGQVARKSAKSCDPQWVPAEDTLGDYVNLKLPPINEQAVSLTELECWIVGRYLADGSMGPRGDFWISVGRDKLADFEQKVGAHAGTRSHGTAIQIRMRGLSAQLNAMLERCGRGAGNKQVPVEFLSAPADKARALLEGYLSGDGHLVPGRNTWMATSVSRALLLGMAMLSQRAFGAVATLRPGREPGQTTIEGRTVNTRQEWITSFDVPSPTRRMKPFVMADGAWKKVRSIEDAGEVETWCLQVEEDASFTAEGCIVKNCPLQLEVIRRGIVLWSNPGDVVFSPFAGIGSEGYVALKNGRKFVGIELKRSYFEQAVRNLRNATSQKTLFDVT
jgi:hypothetical protein